MCVCDFGKIRTRTRNFAQLKYGFHIVRQCNEKKMLGFLANTAYRICTMYVGMLRSLAFDFLYVIRLETKESNAN